MIQAKSEQQANTETSGSTWTGLYKVGGVAPLAALALSLIQIGVMIAGNLSGEPFPTNLESWFLLLQRNKILGLFYLNALDIFTIALLGVMFLALYIALRATNPSAMLIAAYFAFLGIAAFVIPQRGHAFDIDTQQPVCGCHVRNPEIPASGSRRSAGCSRYGNAPNHGLLFYRHRHVDNLNCHTTQRAFQ